MIESLCSCNHAQLPESPKSRRARFLTIKRNQHASQRRAISLNISIDSRIAVPAVITSSTSITVLVTRYQPDYRLHRGLLPLWVKAVRQVQVMMLRQRHGGSVAIGIPL